VHTFFETETSSHSEFSSNPFLILQSGSSQSERDVAVIGALVMSEQFLQGGDTGSSWQQQQQLAIHRVFICMAAKIPSFIMAVSLMAWAQVFECSWTVDTGLCLQCCRLTVSVCFEDHHARDSLSVETPVGVLVGSRLRCAVVVSFGRHAQIQILHSQSQTVLATTLPCGQISIIAS